MPLLRNIRLYVKLLIGMTDIRRKTIGMAMHQLRRDSLKGKATSGIGIDRMAMSIVQSLRYEGIELGIDDTKEAIIRLIDRGVVYE